MIGHSWRSGTDQSMLVWELTLYKARFGIQNVILSLLFEDLQEVISKMPKATQKSVAMEEEGDDLHGVVNLLEAKAHTNSLDQVMTLIQEQVKEGNTTDLLERAMSNMKTTLANTILTMQLADISMVTRAI